MASFKLNNVNKKGPRYFAVVSKMEMIISYKKRIEIW